MNNKLLLFLMILMVSINLVSSSISITTSKLEYLAGENVSITFLLESPQFFSGNLIIEIIPPERSDTQEAFSSKINLNPYQIQVIKKYFQIDENNLPGLYKITGRFIDTNSTFIMQNTTFFNVVGTKDYFIFNPKICKDVTCLKESKIFIKNEDIFIDYDSDVSDLSIDATLIYPDKKIEQITLPTTIKASKIGTYDLEVTASKDGYKTITEKIQLGVIEKQAKIKKVSIKKEAELHTQSPDYLIIILLVFVVAVLFVLNYRKKKRK